MEKAVKNEAQHDAKQKPSQGKFDGFAGKGGEIALAQARGSMAMGTGNSKESIPTKRKSTETNETTSMHSPSSLSTQSGRQLNTVMNAAAQRNSKRKTDNTRAANMARVRWCCIQRVEQRFIVHPEWHIKVVWDILILMFVFFNAITLPFYLGFNFEPSSGVKTFEQLLDVCFIIDFFLSFRTGFLEKGKLVVDSRRIAKNYLVSWFAIDFVAVVPIEFILSLENAGLLSATKCVRLLRLGRFAKKMEAWKSLNVAKVVILFIAFVMLAHWVGCGWALINFSPETGYSSIMLHPDQEPDPPLDRVYLRCLYISLLLLLGDNVEPSDETAMFYSFLMLLLGSIFYSVIFGNMALLVVNFDRSTIMYKDKMDKINQDLNILQVPENLATRVRKYFRTLWLYHRSAFVGYSVMTEISRSLQIEVLIHNCKDTLFEVPLFLGLDMEFILGVAVQLETELFLEGQIIFNEGDHGDCMYFIEEGCVQIYSEKLDVVFVELHKGEYMGEISLVVGEPRNASAKASLVTILKTLSQEKFDAVCQAFPEQSEIVQQRGRKSWAEQKHRKANGKHGSITSLSSEAGAQGSPLLIEAARQGAPLMIEAARSTALTLKQAATDASAITSAAVASSSATNPHQSISPHEPLPGRLSDSPPLSEARKTELAMQRLKSSMKTFTDAKPPAGLETSFGAGMAGPNKKVSKLAAAVNMAFNQHRSTVPTRTDEGEHLTVLTGKVQALQTNSERLESTLDDILDMLTRGTCLNAST